jgi:hypothetical protein
MRHLSAEQLVLFMDGQGAPAAGQHLESCAPCRARLAEFEQTMADFVQARAAAPPPPDAARARLLARLQTEARSAAGAGTELSRAAAAACLALLFAVAGAVWMAGLPDSNSVADGMPDPRLTPGETIPITAAQVCAGDSDSTAPRDVALQVFAAYGIRDPEPRAYEVDYLITPALGGSDSVRNFWPQPYRNTVWSAHVKDALEDLLQRKVCAGEIALETAQRELARDWIGAYRRHFRTLEPLQQHAGFLKDRPWE